MRSAIERTTRLPNHKLTDGCIIMWVLFALAAFIICNVALYYHPFAAYGQTASIKAQWDYGREPDVMEFRLFYGETSGSYAISYAVPVSLWVEPPNWMTLAVPLEPGTYYFAVQAVDTSGNVSEFSNEAMLTVPDTIPPGGCQGLNVELP